MKNIKIILKFVVFLPYARIDKQYSFFFFSSHHLNRQLLLLAMTRCLLVVVAVAAAAAVVVAPSKDSDLMQLRTSRVEPLTDTT